MKHGLYVHIPFCRYRCDYCGFFSVSCHELNLNKNDNLINRYVDALISEIRQRIAKTKNFVFDTIYFGGGTPSLISPESVYNIIKEIRNSAEISEDREFSIEINPEDVERERLAAFRDAGLNRFILGVQTLKERLHSELGRSTRLCNRRIIADFFNIKEIVHCVDIILGIPTQTKKDLDDDIDDILKFRPPHISAYILSIDEGTPLFCRVDKSIELEERQADLYYYTLEKLTDSGYRHYEISNFAIPGFESVHNLKYWKFLPYIGIGAGAHSFHSGRRYFNDMSIDEYIDSERVVLREDRRSKLSPVIEYILTGLRLVDGISLDRLELQFNYKITDSLMDKICELSDKGLINRRDNNNERRIWLSKKALIISDSVIFEIIDKIV